MSSLYSLLVETSLICDMCCPLQASLWTPWKPCNRSFGHFSHWFLQASKGKSCHLTKFASSLENVNVSHDPADEKSACCVHRGRSKRCHDLQRWIRDMYDHVRCTICWGTHGVAVCSVFHYDSMQARNFMQQGGAILVGGHQHVDMAVHLSGWKDIKHTAGLWLYDLWPLAIASRNCLEIY